MALAREDDEPQPLAEAELTRLVQAAGKADYQPALDMPKARSTAFHKRSLMEIARETLPEPKAAPTPGPQQAAPSNTTDSATPALQPSDAWPADVADPAPDAAGTAAPPSSATKAEDAAARADTPDGRAPQAPPASERAQTSPPSTAVPTPQPAHSAPSAEALRAARDEGYQAGKAASEAETEARLGSALAALDAAVAALNNPDPAAYADLRAEIARSVLALASGRAGQQIDALPGPFLRRIEALADRVQADLAQTAIRLNPDDLRAIAPALSEIAPLAAARLIADDGLARGDIDLAVGGLRLTDRIGTDPASAAQLGPPADPDTLSQDAPQADATADLHDPSGAADPA